MIRLIQRLLKRRSDVAVAVGHARQTQTVLVTGAAGQVGTAVRPMLRAAFPRVVLTDRVDVSDLAPNESFFAADFEDPASFASRLRGIDAIVHLAALSLDAPLDRLLAVNVVAVNTLLNLAIAHGVQRVMLASSMHALGLYRRNETILPTSQPKADSTYAASKVVMEQVGAMYAASGALHVTSIRIGCLKNRREDAEPGGWIGPTDLAALIVLALTHSKTSGVTMNAVAKHSGDDCGQRWLEKNFGFRFTEDAVAYEKSLRSLHYWYPKDEIAREFRGGEFASRTLGQLVRVP